jgi:hypothetical protein
VPIYRRLEILLYSCHVLNQCEIFVDDGTSSAALIDARTCFTRSKIGHLWLLNFRLWQDKKMLLLMSADSS